MLQYSLLFLEFALLGAMAYLYFTTRKTVEETAQNNSPINPSGWMQGQLSATQMAQEITQLMEELQTITNHARADLLKQRDDLQELLAQTETAAAELRSLLEQTEQNERPAPEATPPAPEPASWQPTRLAAANSTPTNEPQAEPLVPLELIYSPAQFGEYLHISGCGPEVVSLATEHAQEFVIWFTNQFDDDETPPRLIESQYLEEYQYYMEDQRLDVDTIKRRLIALRAYINWANNISQLGNVPAKPEPDPDTETNQRAAVAMLRGSEPLPAEPPKPKETVIPAPRDMDRYHTVMSLAEQGLDQLAIAARTGLEQEAVRMIMMLNRSAVAG